MSLATYVGVLLNLVLPRRVDEKVAVAGATDADV